MVPLKTIIILEKATLSYAFVKNAQHQNVNLCKMIYMLCAKNIGFWPIRNENITIENVPKGSTTLHICKSCVNKYHKSKIVCEECKKNSYENMNKYLKTVGH